MEHENDEQIHAPLRTDLDQITTHIDDLKIGIEAVLRTAHLTLSEKAATLRADLEQLEADLDAEGADAHARQVMGRIRELNALGAAAYQLLQADIAAQRNLTEAEIRTLETLASSAIGENKVRLMARIEHLKATRNDSQPIPTDSDR